MIKVFNYPQEQKEAEKFIDDNPVNHVWHDGAVMRVYTGADIPKDEDENI